MTANARRLALLAVCAVAATTAAPAAQGKDTLWTEVTASAATIRLAWDKDHPLDADLKGARADLVVRYVNEQGLEVAENLGRGTRTPDSARAVEFALPAELRGSPGGRVCLAIQLQDRRFLPVRRARTGDPDTAGFVYPAWAELVERRAQARVLDRDIDQLRRALAVAVRNVTTTERAAAARGWTDPTSCVAPMAMVSSLPTPFDVVAPERQDSEARRVCIGRVRSAIGLTIKGERARQRLRELEAAGKLDGARQLLFSEYAEARVVEASAWLAKVEKELGPEHPLVRLHRDEKRQFDTDWARFSNDQLATPLLGATDDVVAWPSEARSVAFRVLGGHTLARELDAGWAVAGLPEATAGDVFAMVDAAFAAYDGCVEDSTKQLRLKHDAWQARAAAAPQRALAQGEFFARECRQGLADRDQRRSERDAFARDLQLREHQRAALGIPGGLPTRRLELNHSGCRQH